MRDEGRAVALVSHKLDEVLHATDRITIMRDGDVVASLRTAEADARGLARAMVGREVSLRSESVAVGAIEAAARATVGVVSHADDPVVLSIAGATVRARDGSVLLDNLDLDVRQGEVLGVAGVEGNGQRTLGDVLASLTRLDAGMVEVAGRPVATGRAGAMAKAGVGAIPEDRHDSGVVLDMTVAENLILSAPEIVARRGIFDRAALHARAADLIAEFDIQCEGPDAPLWSLSGGNQQRVVLARELSLDPVVLVAAQPTRGLDVGAIEYMTERLKQAAGDGVGVLLISTELEEILALSHRIVVLFRGRVVGSMDRTDLDLERLGLLLGGVAA